MIGRIVDDAIDRRRMRDHFVGNLAGIELRKRIADSAHHFGVDLEERVIEKLRIGLLRYVGRAHDRCWIGSGNFREDVDGHHVHHMHLRVVAFGNSTRRVERALGVIGSIEGNDDAVVSHDNSSNE